MPKKRTILLMPTTMLFAVLVIGGVAFALDFTCDGSSDADPDPGECTGTRQADEIVGTGDPDNIDARGRRRHGVWAGQRRHDPRP